MGGLSTYGYASANPLVNSDPFGLYVELSFDRRSGILTARDVDTGESVLVPAFSGNRFANDSRYEGVPFAGPLPAGTYLVGNGKERSGEDVWYPLLSPDGKGNYTYRACRNVKNPFTGQMECRNMFNIHNDLASDGCVTVPSTVSKGDPKFPQSKQFDALKRLLENTKPLVINGNTYRGWLNVGG
jgi:hypothetical protein